MNWLLTQDLKNLEAGSMTDATITCGDRIWNIHKILISRCKWFKMAFDGNFQVKEFAMYLHGAARGWLTDTAAVVQEAQTNNVNIPAEDFSPELVDAAICFIYSGVVDIERLDTNDSVVDACVQLWAIADYLMLTELQDEAIKIMEENLDDTMKALCGFSEERLRNDMSEDDFDKFLAQSSRGIETAYTTYPHSVPCQKVLVTFFHAASTVLGPGAMSEILSDEAPEFSHELYKTILRGEPSKWFTQQRPDFGGERRGNCTGCRVSTSEYDGAFVVHPSNSRWGYHWRCMPCLEEHAFDRAV